MNRFFRTLLLAAALAYRAARKWRLLLTIR